MIQKKTASNAPSQPPSLSSRMPTPRFRLSRPAGGARQRASRSPAVLTPPSDPPQELPRPAPRWRLLVGSLALAASLAGCEPESKPQATPPAASAPPQPDNQAGPLHRLGLASVRPADLAGEQAQRALQQLQTSPCNSQAMGTLAPVLKRNGYRKEAAHALITFANECGNADGFLYSALDDLLVIGQYQQAIDIANHLVKNSPTNAQIRYTRAQAYTYTEQHELALADYQEVIALSPDLARVASGVFTRTAHAQAKLGRPCEAASTIRMWISQDAERMENTPSKRLISEYEHQQNCPLSYASGKDVFARKQNQVIIVSAEINGKKGTFIVDTGASVVTLTQAFAKRAAIPYDEGRAVTMQTANGRTLARLAIAEQIKLRNTSANQVQVAVHSEAGHTFGAGIDGLLGQSFLSRFDTTFSARQWTISVPATGVVAKN